MNRHLHRLVFSRRQGRLVAVAESATAQGKSAGQTSGQTPARAAVARLALASVLAFSPLAQALAQVVADPSAPKTQQATVLAAPNGVPLVNIQTPSAAGVSRNTYSQFDVQGDGVILNNSRGNVQTQQGGWVQGNPWLARGEARVILNEVNSSNPSQIRGYIEVAGQRAEVIVANPAGIQVDGGGFINASRATLVTGQVQTGDSGLQGYTVSGGTITIDGRGLDASLTDYTGLLAQAVKANAGVWAKQLQVVTGHNQISADPSSVQATPAANASPADGPAFALDVSSLGGMYAGKITLLGTQAGLGMRNAGQIGASAGELVVTADGRLENTGTLQGQGGVDIAAASMANGGQILSPQQVKVRTAADLGNAGGSIQAQRLELVSGSGIDNTGGTLAQTTAGLAVTARTVDNSQGQFGTPQQAADTGGAATPSAPSDGSGTATEGGTTATGTSTGTGGATGSGTAAGGTAVATPLPPGLIQAAGALVNQGGKVESGGAVSLQTQALDNRQGQMRLDSLQVSGGTLDNSSGQITAAGDVTVAGQSVDSRDGSIQAQNIRLSASQGVSLGGSAQLAARQTLSVDAAQVDSSGTLRSGGDTAIRAGGPVNSSGQVYAGGNLAITSLGTVTNTGVAGAAGDTTVTAARLASRAGSTLAAGLQADGRLAGNGRLQTRATGQTTLQGSTLSAGEQSHSAAALDVSGPGSRLSGLSVTLEAKSGGLDASGARLTAAQTLKATTPGLLDTRGASVSAARLDLAAQALDNGGGRLSQSGSEDMTLDLAGTLSNRQGVLESSGRNLTLKAAVLDSSAGRITHSTADASGQLAITTQSLDGAGATIQGNGGVSLQAPLARLGGATTTAVGALDIRSQTLDASGGTLQGDSIRLGASQALTLGGSAQVSSVKGLQIDAGQVDSGGTLRSGGDTAIQASGPVSNAGQVYAGGNLAITSVGAVTNTGLAGAAGDTTVTAARITSTAGSTLAAGLQADGRVPADTSATLRTRASADTVLAGAVLATGTQEHSAAALDVSGNTLQARDIRLQARTGAVSAAGASLTATGTLAVQAATLLDTQGATATAGQLELAAHDISNAGGRLQQSGDAATTISLPGHFDNSHGTLVSNGQNLTIKVGGIDNTQGQIAHSPDDGKGLLTMESQSLSGAQGRIQGNGSVVLAVDRANLNGAITTAVNNISFTGGDIAHSRGLMTAGEAARIQASGLVSNAQGTLYGGQRIDVFAENIDNTAGSVLSPNSPIRLSAKSVVNQSGAIKSAGDVFLETGSLDNRQSDPGAPESMIYGKAVTIASSGAIKNTRGNVVSVANLDIKASELDNSQGVIQSGENSVIEAKAITNSAGALVSGGRINLAGTDFVNREGDVSAAGSLAITTERVDNASGRIVAGADLSISAIAGSMVNTKGFVGALGALAVRAQSVVNAATLPTQAGLQGDSVSIQTDQLDNTNGSVRALTGVAIGADQSVANASGLISAGTDLSIAAGATGTLPAVDNRGGRLIADGNVAITGASLSGDGGIIAVRGGVALDLQGGYTQTASGLFQGRSVSITSKDDISIQKGAEIQSGSINMISTSNLVNRGVISADAVKMKANTIRNLGAGAIFGGAIALEANQVLNASESEGAEETAASVAASRDLTIAAQDVKNLSGSLLFSAGGMSIGGLPGADGTTYGQADLLLNSSSDIESAHDMRISANSVQNINPSFTVSESERTEAISINYVTRNLHEGTSYKWDELGRCFKCTRFEDSGGNLVRHEIVTPSEKYPFEAGFQRHPYNLDINYPESSNVWALFNVPAGDQDLLKIRLSSYNADFMARGLREFYNVTAKENKISETVVSNPGRQASISSGGNIDFSGPIVRNENSRIIAGLSIFNSGRLDNIESLGFRKVTESGSWTYDFVEHSPYRYKTADRGRRGAYEKVTENKSGIHLESTKYEQNTLVKNRSVQAPVAALLGAAPANTTDIAVSGFGIDGSSLNPQTQSGLGVASASAGVMTASQIDAATVAPSGSAKTDLVAKFIGPDRTTAVRTITFSALTPLPVSANSLFVTNADAPKGYVVETDARFASYRQWLSSDYMLKALSLDPVTTQKRLGDGFYEQRLINEQVAQLTGRRYLGNYTTDDQQYRSLMDNGATFAQSHQLRPGIALTAAQIAQLTSDIVWLVAQDVKLPDGTTTLALVPQVYARALPGDLDGSGALISAGRIDMRLSGDLNNTGQILGRDLVRINADSIQQMAGRMRGLAVELKSTQDLHVGGGRIEAAQLMSLDAGHDLTVASSVSDAQADLAHSSSRLRQLDRVAGLYVSDAAGVLAARAGQDVNLTAAQIESAGSLVIGAGRDINLQSLETGGSLFVESGANLRDYSASSRDEGSTLKAAGTLRLEAGRDMAARALLAEAGKGLSVDAGRDVRLQSGTASTDRDQYMHTQGGGLLSGWSSTSHIVTHGESAQASELSGSTVSIAAGRDVAVSGSTVLSDAGTSIAAVRDVSVTAAKQHTTNESAYSQSSSGLLGGGGLSLTLGTRSQSSAQKQAGDTAAGSVIGSTGGSVSIQAGQTYTQTGSDVLAPQGDIGIQAKKVDITEAREKRSDSSESKFSQSGLSVSLGGGIIDTARATAEGIQGLADGGARRSKALNALVAYAKGADLVAQGAAVVNAADRNGVMGTTGADGKAEPGAAAASGIRLSISAGSSRSQSSSSTAADSASGATVKAGGNVRISSAEDSLNVRGSRVEAGRDVELDGVMDVNVIASSSAESTRASNSSSAASIGGSVGIGSGGAGLSVDVAASRGKGQANSDSATYDNSRIVAGNAVRISSGADTNIKGGNVSGRQTVVQSGGSLNVESLQDTATSNASQKNAGVSASVPVAGSGGSANLSLASQKSSSSYASVHEQSGIQAGDGGFQIRVQGNTDLKGAVLSSSADAGANRLDTGSLTTGDLENRMSASASSSGISAGTEMLSGKYGLAKGIAGNLLNKGGASTGDVSTTASAISAAKVTVGGKTTDTGSETLLDSDGKTVKTATEDTHRALDKADVVALQQKAQDKQEANVLAFKAATAFTEEAYRTMYKAGARLYKVPPGCSDRTCAVPLSENEALALKNSQDGKLHISNNGIFNDLDGAVKYAQNHGGIINSDGSKNYSDKPTEQYIIFAPQSNNILSELIVAAVAKSGLTPLVGLTNAEEQTARVVQQAAQQGQSNVIDSHSRGTMTTDNALEWINRQGGIKDANGEKVTPVIDLNNYGGAQNNESGNQTLRQVTGNSNAEINSVIHPKDIVGKSAAVGNNAVTPNYSSTAADGTKLTVEATDDGKGTWGNLWNVFTGTATPHNCYGTAREVRGCGEQWSNIPKNNAQPYNSKFNYVPPIIPPNYQGADELTVQLRRGSGYQINRLLRKIQSSPVAETNSQLTDKADAPKNFEPRK